MFGFLFFIFSSAYSAAGKHYVYFTEFYQERSVIGISLFKIRHVALNNSLCLFVAIHNDNLHQAHETKLLKFHYKKNLSKK
jgi:hypothetical protein